MPPLGQNTLPEPISDEKRTLSVWGFDRGAVSAVLNQVTEQVKANTAIRRLSGYRTAFKKTVWVCKICALRLSWKIWMLVLPEFWCCWFCLLFFVCLFLLLFCLCGFCLFVLCVFFWGVNRYKTRKNLGLWPKWLLAIQWAPTVFHTGWLGVKHQLTYLLQLFYCSTNVTITATVLASL